MRRCLVIPAFMIALSGCATGTAAGARPDGPDGAGGTGGFVTAACATATSPPARETDGTPQPANQNMLGEVANRVQPRAQADFADVYAGLRLVGERNRIEVFRTPSATFDAWIRTDFANDCVQVTDAPYAERDLDARRTRVSADFAYWRGNGIDIYTVSSDFVRGAVTVGVNESDVDTARQVMPAHYGPGVPIEIEAQSPIMPL
jgi:hypothetical protein